MTENRFRIFDARLARSEQPDVPKLPQTAYIKSDLGGALFTRYFSNRPEGLRLDYVILSRRPLSYNLLRRFGHGAEKKVNSDNEESTIIRIYRRAANTFRRFLKVSESSNRTGDPIHRHLASLSLGFIADDFFTRRRYRSKLHVKDK